LGGDLPKEKTWVGQNEAQPKIPRSKAGRKEYNGSGGGGNPAIQKKGELFSAKG